MRAFSYRMIVGGALVASLTACQTTTPPATSVAPVAKAAEGPSKSFGNRKGWEVLVVDATADAPTHCLGRATQPGSPAISFVGAATESGFTLQGVSTTLAPGTAERLLVRFDTGDSRSYDAKVEADGALTVRYPTQRYDEMTFPFARGKQAVVSGAKAGAIATLKLTGSTWAVNATDECRRINARK